MTLTIRLHGSPDSSTAGPKHIENLSYLCVLIAIYLYKGRFLRVSLFLVYSFPLRIMFKKWYFFVEVEEGPTGWEDSDAYLSPLYDSFEDCYKNYLNFSPSENWRYLRHVTDEMLIYKCGKNIKENRLDGGLLHYDPSRILEEFGVSEDDFYRIINQLKQ